MTWGQGGNEAELILGNPLSHNDLPSRISVVQSSETELASFSFTTQILPATGH